MADSKGRIGPDDLGIGLGPASDAAVFRWLVACQLFGARISQDIAARTFTELDKAGVLTPRKLAGADWQRLVDLLGAGGYRRYDESTARELIAVGKLAVDKYRGKITRIRGRGEQEAGCRPVAGIPGSRAYSGADLPAGDGTDLEIVNGAADTRSSAEPAAHPQRRGTDGDDGRSQWPVTFAPTRCASPPAR